MGHFIIPYPGMFLYTASKHSVTVLTEGLRKELSDLKSNIRITVRRLFLLSTSDILKKVKNILILECESCANKN
jgi:short-subunit dehydrogenase